MIKNIKKMTQFPCAAINWDEFPILVRCKRDHQQSE